MASLGRLIFFDQPGTGASDPVTPDALPTLEQWADSITAVLDDLGSREAVLATVDGAFATGAMFAATHPSRTTVLVALEGYANFEGNDDVKSEEVLADHVAMWGTGDYWHAINPDMPWNDEEIRAACARHDRLAASPRTYAQMTPLVTEVDVRALLPAIRVPTLVVHHKDDPRSDPSGESTSRTTYQARNTLSCRAATCTTS